MTKKRTGRDQPSKALAAFLKSLHTSIEDSHRLAAAGRKTPLHHAAEIGHAGHVEELIALGAEVNAVVSLVGMTPLAEAVARGQVAAAEILLQAGADPNLGSSLLDEAVLTCNAPMVELLRRHGARGSKQPRLDLDAGTLERIRQAVMVEGRNLIEVVSDLNRDRVPPISGDGPWDYVMVLGALEVAEKQRRVGQPERLAMGGNLVLLLGGKQVSFEITDAAYGVVYREDEPDVFELAGNAVSVCANVARGPVTEAVARGDWARLAGAELPLRDRGNAFEDPFLVLPGGVRMPIIGGKMTVEKAEAVPGALEQHDASGKLTAILELVAGPPGGEKRYRGRLEVAFVSS